MASLDELMEELVTTPQETPPPTVEDVADINATMADDIDEALTLLSKAMKLLDALSDVDICKTLTKRERDAMERVSGLIREFLDDVESNYVNDEEVE